MSILQYGFMQRAFLVGILLAVITPCIGITIVLKRMSMIGDALSHSSLAGVVLGLILGVNPVAGAVVMCIVAALGIEAIRKKIPRYSEVAISIVMSAGIGLAGVLSGFVENGASLNSFLFGSIVSISEGELALVVVISVLVLAAVLLVGTAAAVTASLWDSFFGRLDPGEQAVVDTLSGGLPGAVSAGGAMMTPMAAFGMDGVFYLMLEIQARSCHPWTVKMKPTSSSAMIF